jgi:hypothetical protein
MSKRRRTGKQDILKHVLELLISMIITGNRKGKYVKIH